MFGMGVVLAPALGPSIGGVLVDWFGWRSIFFMVAPFCLAALWLARRYVPATAPGGAAARRGEALDMGPAAGQRRHAGPAQWAGGAARRHRGAAGALLGLALACGGLFIGWQRRRARAARCR
jgi:MFS family permease